MEGGWAPRRDAWGVQLTDEVVPALMSGPDPSDLLEDSPDEQLWRDLLAQIDDEWKLLADEPDDPSVN